MKGLITCFENFDGVSDNTSKKVVESLNLPSLVLPVSFNRCDQSLPQDMDFIIQVGVAASRSEITIERYAHNLAHSPTQPDNDGQKPVHQRIVQHAPLALETNIEVNLLDTIPGKWSWSLSAGSYVCNALYFKTLLNLPNTKTVFLHIPYHLKMDDPEKSLQHSAQLITAVFMLMSNIVIKTTNQ